MQFFYKVGNFSSGYSSVHVLKAAGSPVVITYPSLDVTANGSTTIVIQVSSGSWRMNNSGVNNQSAAPSVTALPSARVQRRATPSQRTAMSSPSASAPSLARSRELTRWMPEWCPERAALVVS